MTNDDSADDVLLRPVSYWLTCPRCRTYGERETHGEWPREWAHCLNCGAWWKPYTVVIDEAHKG